MSIILLIHSCIFYIRFHRSGQSETEWNRMKLSVFPAWEY